MTLILNTPWLWDAGEEGSSCKYTSDASDFEVYLHDEPVGAVSWQLVGEHNMHNALMAYCCRVRYVGVRPVDACLALDRLINASRRLEL